MRLPASLNCSDITIMDALLLSVIMICLTGTVSACSCPPAPAPTGAEPTVRLPSLQANNVLFVGLVEEVYPEDLSTYKDRWRKIYHEDLSEDKPPTADRMRTFILEFWPKLFSPSE